MKSLIKNDGEIPPYLDEKNEFFSIELKIAIETWMEFYLNGRYDGTRRAQNKKILEYLEEEYPGKTVICKAAKERIATMVNTVKDSGARPTDY